MLISISVCAYGVNKETIGGDVPKSSKSESTGNNQGSRRDAIISAAIELIAEKGCAAVQAQEIASFAGVSRRLMWYHFKTKEELQDEADRVVLEALLQLPEADPSSNYTDRAQFLLTARLGSRTYPMHMAYLMQMLVSGSTRGTSAFETVLKLYDFLGIRVDPANCSLEEREREITMISILLGPLLLRDYIKEYYGVEVGDAEEARARTEIQTKIFKALMKADKKG